MKKLNLFPMLLVAVVMMLSLTNCKKDLKESTPESKQYVDVMDASFNLVPAVQLTTKGFDPNPDLTLTTNTWSTYTNNTVFYPLANHYSLVRGLEFITNSIAWNFWHIDANNPVTLSGSVFQNQIPVEPIRLAVEGRNANGAVAFIGMRDFQPANANFPMDVVEYRLGDKVEIDADALFNMAPTGTFTITASYDLAPINLEATKMQETLASGALDFDDIKLDASVPTSKAVVAGGSTLYNGLGSKVVGTINIQIVENWDGLDGHHTATINVSTPAFEYGKGMKIVLSTTKLGWYDSAVSAITTQDIVVETVPVPVN